MSCQRVYMYNEITRKLLYKALPFLMWWWVGATRLARKIMALCRGFLQNCIRLHPGESPLQVFTPKTVEPYIKTKSTQELT